MFLVAGSLPFQSERKVVAAVVIFNLNLLVGFCLVCVSPADHFGGRLVREHDRTCSFIARVLNLHLHLPAALLLPDIALLEVERRLEDVS